jgi:hypothetical protein
MSSQIFDVIRLPLIFRYAISRCLIFRFSRRAFAATRLRCAAIRRRRHCGCRPLATDAEAIIDTRYAIFAQPLRRQPRHYSLFH